jgi:hypothetical protein
MPKNKRPAPKKTSSAAEPDTDAQAQVLCDLALTIAEAEDGDADAADAQDELATLVGRALRRKQDDVLYGAIELARYTDPEACRLLRERIGEEAASVRIRREGAPELEIDAFMVPLFARSTGGLLEAEAFQDDAAYDALLDSFKQAGLESKDARVVLVRHVYDLGEVDRIGFSVLGEMLREVAASMTSKKSAPVPLLEASMRGWSGERFGPADEAMELRFLLGFSLKRADDPFYAVPKDEAGADAWFDARMERYRAWTVDAAPLVKRSLAADPGRLALDFLYQDLFFGAREQGLDELATLATLAEVNRVLDPHGAGPSAVRAVVAPLERGDQAVLHLKLFRDAGGELLGTVEKPVDLSADLGAAMDDLCDALATLGMGRIDTAAGFDQQGQPEGAKPWQRA